MLDKTPSSVPIFRNGHAVIEQRAQIFDRRLIDNSFLGAKLRPGGPGNFGDFFLNKLDDGDMKVYAW